MPCFISSPPFCWEGWSSRPSSASWNPQLLSAFAPGSLGLCLLSWPHTHMFISKNESSKLCSCQCFIFLFILNPGQICPFRSFRSFIEHGRISNFIFRSIYTFKILPSDVGYFQAMIELCKS